MANKPLRPCRHPGCTVLVPDGYCDAHRPKDRDRRSQEAHVKAGKRALKVAACWADSSLYDAVEVHLTLSLTVDRADFQPAELLPIMQNLSTKTITSEEEL